MRNINLGKEERDWYHGKFHYHSVEVEGELPLEKIIEFYKHRGYGFLTFLDFHIFDDSSFFEDDDEFLVDPWY